MIRKRECLFHRRFPFWVHKFFLCSLFKDFFLFLSCVCVCVLVAQLCPTLCDPMDCNPPGSSVHEIFQARILEWVAISFSRGSSQPRDRTRVSCIAGRFFTTEPQGKPILGKPLHYLIVAIQCQKQEVRSLLPWRFSSSVGETENKQIK